MGGDHHVISADDHAAALEVGADLPVMRGGRSVERLDGEPGGEGFDRPPVLAGTGGLFSAEQARASR
jgi:hypothetical protein